MLSHSATIENVRFLVLFTLAGLSLVAAGCGGGAAVTTSTGSAHQKEALAYAGCMRTHGVPDFPDPDPQGDFPSFRPREAKRVAAEADGACRHLLSSGGTATPQQRTQKLAFGVKVAECLRTHGFPNMPDPTGLGSTQVPPGIDLKSPRFQTAETACEQQARKALGLP